MIEVVARTTTYTVRGAIKACTDNVVSHPATLRDAFREVYASGHVPKFTAHHRSIGYFVRQDGQRVTVEDFYRQAVGEAEFQRQLADDGFSINLDEWFLTTQA